MDKKHKNNAFKTPENYFEGFNDRLFDRLQEDNNLLPVQDGLKVPDGYFDTLDDKIAQRLEQKAAPAVFNLRKYRKFYYAAAAIAVLFILVLGFQQTRKNEVTFDSLANSDIENYLDSTDIGLSSYEIAEVVVLDDISIENILDEQLVEENIMEYLDENLDDFDELNLQLDE